MIDALSHWTQTFTAWLNFFNLAGDCGAVRNNNSNEICFESSMVDRVDTSVEFEIVLE